MIYKFFLIFLFLITKSFANEACEISIPNKIEGIQVTIQKLPVNNRTSGIVNLAENYPVHHHAINRNKAAYLATYIKKNNIKNVAHTSIEFNFDEAPNDRRISYLLFKINELTGSGMIYHLHNVFYSENYCAVFVSASTKDKEYYPNLIDHLEKLRKDFFLKDPSFWKYYPHNEGYFPDTFDVLYSLCLFIVALLFLKLISVVAKRK